MTSFVIAKVEGLSEDAQSTGDIEKVKKEIQKVLKRFSAKLEIFLKEYLQQITTDMFYNDLVSQTTKNEPSLAKVMIQFMAGMNFINDCQELVEYCKLFLCILAQQGDLFKRAANTIVQEWTTTVERTGCEFEI